MRAGSREHGSHVAMPNPRTPLHFGHPSRVQRNSSSMHRAMEEDRLMTRYDDDSRPNNCENDERGPYTHKINTNIFIYKKYHHYMTHILISQTTQQKKVGEICGTGVYVLHYYQYFIWIWCIPPSDLFSNVYQTSQPRLIC